MPDFSRLDAYLDENGLDGYLIDADGEVSDQRYLAGFGAPDPFRTLYTPEGTSLLVSGLEYGRARRESRADAVRRSTDYGIDTYGSAADRYDAIAAFLAEFDAEVVGVPERFPVGTADGLRERGVTVGPDEDGIVTEIRAVKTDEEVGHVEAAQRANEAALAAAEALIADASIEDGTLHHEGEALTAERVKQEIEVTLLGHGCGLDETIVAGGADGADPHDRGSGPLPAHEPIVIDVFPRDKETKYHSDMTRTFLRGEPSEEVGRRHAITEEALDAALAAVEPGATGKDVHDAACAVYEDAGYPTLRADPETEVGYIHSTGHGVGLDVHELPTLSPRGGELRPGHVITVEPGLYDPDHGGMRIEDIVVVSEDGYENLTDYHRDLVVG